MAIVVVLAAGVGLVRAIQESADANGEGHWSSSSSMAIARAYHTATPLTNGKVLVVGGRGSLSLTAPWQPGGSALASAELYDPGTRTWSNAGQLSTPRFGHTATLLPNGNVLVVGGDRTIPTADSPFGALASAELYDPKSNRWSVAASMHEARVNHTATLLPDGRVLVAGGHPALAVNPANNLMSAELYDPTTSTWTEAAPMPSPRADQAAVLLRDGRVLVVGGVDQFFHWPLGSAPSVGLSTAVLYDPASNAWTLTAPMHYPRISPTATLLPDGRVLVVGDSGTNPQTTEIYDPGSDSWQTASRPGTPRAEHVAVPLPGGRVLVAGGLGETRAELFDWRRNIWITAGNLASIRGGAAAALMRNGQVLMTGGFGSLATPWATVERYDPAGRPSVAVESRTVAPMILGTVAPFFGLTGLLLLLGLWWVRRRAASSSLVDRWID
ncbi:MAG TPA: kelch repeat-containing protein [Candidatus Dormibacteraeota bacterium]|nr:kelch repeat-containing protein [Candidatus Dormibacteraeota bacterium]